MTKEELNILQNLIEKATPFLDGGIVDETSGTITLMDALEDAINKAKMLINSPCL